MTMADADASAPSGSGSSTRTTGPSGPGRPWTRATQREAEPHHGFPEATDQAHRDGWFHSGNLAEVDADGYLCCRGRATDSMRRLGGDISERELQVRGLREAVRDATAPVVAISPIVSSVPATLYRHVAARSIADVADVADAQLAPATGEPADVGGRP